MAKIDIYTNELTALSSRLKNISGTIAEAESMAANVQRNLDFQVAAKAGIDSGITRARNSLKRQNTKVKSLSNLTAVSNQEFMNADARMNRQGISVIGHIITPTTSIAHTLQSLFVHGLINNHWMVGNHFLGSGSILQITGVQQLWPQLGVRPPVHISPITGGIGGMVIGGIVAGSVGASIGMIAGSIAGSVAGGAGSRVSNGNTNSSSGTLGAAGGASGGNSAISPQSAPAQYQNLTSFHAAEYAGKTNGNYTDYSIVGGMNPAYCYNQNNPAYTEKGFHSGGCLACSDACVGSIMEKGEIDPQTVWDNYTTSCQSTTRVGLKTKDDSCNWSPERIREESYKELIQGKPVVLRVQSGSSDGGGHSVVAVGLRNGADPNNLTDADFLIMDPSDGKIKALSERTKAKVLVNGKYIETDTCLKPQQDNAGMRRVK